MQELPVVVRQEELVQVESRIDGLVLILQHDPAAERIVDHGAQLVGVHQELGQALVGIVFLFVPALFGVLLVGIGPVEDLPVGELIPGQLLEGCAGQIQRVGALDVVEGFFSLVGLHTLLRLVHHQQVKGQALSLLACRAVHVLPGHPAQLFVVAAKVDGTLQILQGDESHHALIEAALDVLVPGQDAELAAQGIRIADKAEIVLPADELVEILRPGVGDAGAVGDDQHPLKAHPHDQIIGAQRLAEAGLGVPQELLPAVRKPVRCPGDGALLLFAQRIAQAAFLRRGTPCGKLVEVRPRFRPVYLEPLGFRLAFHMCNGIKIMVELVVSKGQAAAVLVNGVVPPEDLVGDVRGVVLLFDPLLHALLFSIADLRPAQVRRVIRVGIGVDHRDDGLKGANVGCAHFSSSPLHGFR